MPDYVAMLETHRHKGYDLILLTQHPRLIEANVKALTGRHLHIRTNVLGFRQSLEWSDMVAEQPVSPTNIKGAIVKPFRLKKKAFDQYKSSEVHTKQTKKRSFILPFLMLSVLALGVAFYFFYGQWFGKTPVKQNQETINKTTLMTDETPDFKGFAPSSPAQNPIEQRNLDVMLFVPIIPGKPESKPLYNEVRQVVNFEYPEVCISSKDKCKCYTNQGTVLNEIPPDMCRKYAEEWVFNPYKPLLNTTVNNAAPTASKNAT